MVGPCMRMQGSGPRYDQRAAIPIHDPCSLLPRTVDHEGDPDFELVPIGRVGLRLYSDFKPFVVLVGVVFVLLEARALFPLEGIAVHFISSTLISLHFLLPFLVTICTPFPNLISPPPLTSISPLSLPALLPRPVQRRRRLVSDRSCLFANSSFALIGILFEPSPTNPSRSGSNSAGIHNVQQFPFVNNLGVVSESYLIFNSFA